MTTLTERKARRGSVPPLRSLTLEGWRKVVFAMDVARFGKPNSFISWRCTKLYLRNVVIRRVAEGEAFPDGE